MSESQRGRNSHGKRKYGYSGVDHRKKRSNHFLDKGQKGFICTCNFNEKLCIREAYNILDEYSNAQANNEPMPEKLVEEEDVGKALAKEVKELQEQSSRGNVKKFQVVETGSHNCIFIKTTIPNPVDLVVSIMKDIQTTKKQISRFLLRMLPIEITCKASLEKMEEAFKPLVEKHFSSEGKTFSIIYRARCNTNSLSRDEVIEKFAGLVKNAHSENRVDLNNPQLAILVEIIKSICCLSVVPFYVDFRKYNLLELATPKEKAGNNSESCENVKDDKPEGNGEVEKLEADVDDEVPEAEKDDKADDEVFEKPEIDGEVEPSIEDANNLNQD